jgi:hypothetical protein
VCHRVERERSVQRTGARASGHPEASHAIFFVRSLTTFRFFMDHIEVIHMIVKLITV